MAGMRGDSGPKCWILMAYGEDRQYSGNLGYEDDLGHTYRYDSYVANHKQVHEGDLVVVSGKLGVAGYARITTIRVSSGTRVLRRCPTCLQTSFKRRRTMQPTYRCDQKHQFDAPLEEVVPCWKYEAVFGTTFIREHGGIKPGELREYVKRPSAQLAIQELDLLRLTKDAPLSSRSAFSTLAVSG
jgi:hypothetical protein